MKYRAEYRRNGATIKTRFYPTKDQAQEKLAARIGHFHPLGQVSGDTFTTGGQCLDGSRNGGLVSIEAR